MASTLLAVASNLVAVASNLVAGLPQNAPNPFQV